MHLIIDGWSKNEDLLVNILSLKLWLRKAAEVANMTPFGEPTVVDFPFPHKEGTALSAVQFLGESGIVVHTFPSETQEREGFAYIDIFSCLPFDASKVLSFILNSFNIEVYAFYVLERGIDGMGFPHLPKLLKYGRNE